MIELFTDYRQSGQGTGPCPAFSIFLKTFEIIFLTIPAGH